MANRPKRPENKLDTPVQIRVSAPLKAALDEMAYETGVSTSERARQCLEKTVNDWRKSQQ